MFTNLRVTKILWFLTTGLTLSTAVLGVIFPHSYDKVIAPQFIPGALPQDALTIFICLFLFFAISQTTEKSIKLHSVITGIIGSFFYLYGIFTIERVYNLFYIFYLTIFASSFWTIFYSLIHLKEETLNHISLPALFRKPSAIIAILIAVIFTLLWISALIPLLQANHRIDYLYSIYILDLAFVMPAFVITALLSLQNRGLGIIFLPAVYIVGFFVIFPLGLGEVAKPFYGQTPDSGSIFMSFTFSALMLFLAAVSLIKTKLNHG